MRDNLIGTLRFFVTFDADLLGLWMQEHFFCWRYGRQSYNKDIKKENIFTNEEKELLSKFSDVFEIVYNLNSKKYKMRSKDLPTKEGYRIVRKAVDEVLAYPFFQEEFDFLKKEEDKKNKEYIRNFYIQTSNKTIEIYPEDWRVKNKTVNWFPDFLISTEYFLDRFLETEMFSQEEYEALKNITEVSREVLSKLSEKEIKKPLASTEIAKIQEACKKFLDLGSIVKDLEPENNTNS